ncbi:hypothetical protein PL81_12510 [Streptomyces sp. RSD-27]|nr:hypothetical protein PL81_12510 [Streptomyces sp. RSD-27]
MKGVSARIVGVGPTLVRGPASQALTCAMPASVLLSLMASRQRSASRALAQPEPAAVMALAVGVVDDVARGEDARDVRTG